MFLFNKYKSLSVQAKASIWYTICNFFQKGISLIVVPIYIRLLTTDEYGDWSVFQSWRDILIIIASLNLYAGVYTKTIVDIDNAIDRDRYTSSMQGLGTLVTLSLFVIYILFSNWFNSLIGLNSFYMILLFLYFIVYPAFSFWAARQRVEYKYRSMVVVTAIMSILTPFISLLLLQTTALRTLALVLGYLIVQCFFGLIFYVFHFCKNRCFFNKHYWKYAVKYNVPLIPHYLSLIVLNQSDRIMIKEICGESDAGIYSFAYQIASSLSIMISAINGSRVPWTYEQLKSKVYSRLMKITNALVLMFAGITLFVALISPEIIAIIGTEEYAIAVYVIPVVVLGVFFTFVYDLYASLEFYFAATKFVMYASVTGAVLNLVLNYIFIRIFGFIAAAYTTLICYFVFMIMHYIFARKVLKMQKINDSIYDNKTIFLISSFVTVFVLISMMTFRFWYIRIFLILLLILFVFVKRNEIKRIIKTIKR